MRLLGIDELLALPRSGVIVVVDGGIAAVSYTTSMGSVLETLYNSRNGQSNIRLEVLSAGADIETLRLHAEFYRKYYSDLGYEVAPGRKTLQYRVRIIPGKDFKTSDVEVVSARGEGKLVGRFKTIGEAQDFIETYYGTDNPLKLPVYAVNSATKEFLAMRNKKMLKIR